MAINNEPDIHTNVICANVFIRNGDKYLVLRRSPKKKWLPNVIHPVGGKVDLGENPYTTAEREVLEETGAKIKDLKLEAVILEIAPLKNDPMNWLIFHFTADYDSGEIKETEEGSLEWLTSDEIKNENLFPSVREAIDNILSPNDGTVFLTVMYDEKKKKIVNRTKNLCIV